MTKRNKNIVTTDKVLEKPELESGESNDDKRDDDASFYIHVTKGGKRGVPPVVGKYKVPTDSQGTFKIDSKDREFFFEVERNGGVFNSKKANSTGKGEVSLWWLFNCQPGTSLKNVRNKQFGNLNAHVNQGGKKGSDPDLQIGSKFFEVKANNKGMFRRTEGLGRFGRFNDFIALATFIQMAYNFLNLKPISITGNTNKVESLKEVSFSKLAEGAESFCKLRTVIMKSEFDDEPVFVKMRDVFTTFDNICDKYPKYLKKCKMQSGSGSRPGGDVIAISLIRLLAVAILSEKPGFGNYLVNVPTGGSDDEIEYILIDESKMTDERLKDDKNFKIKDGAVKIKFEGLFG